MYLRSSIGAYMLMLLIFNTPGIANSIADAAMKGDKAAIIALIEEQADVNASQADGTTALHWAVYQDDLDMADLLLRAGADVKAETRLGATPLYLASTVGHPAMIDRLLKAGADPNEPLSNGETALMLAARTGSVEALRILVDAGADVNAREGLRGTTALMWAAVNENADAVRFLVEHGADVDAVTDVAGSRGRSGRVSVVRFAQRQSEDGDTETVVASLIAGEGGLPEDAVLLGPEEEDELDLPDPTLGGMTALVYAARQGDMESARILVEAGAGVNQVTSDAWSPLLTATHNRNYKLALFLLDQGADVNLANYGGWTPLYIATDNRSIEGGDYPVRKPDMDHLEFIKILLERGADPNLRVSASTETRTVFTNQWLDENGATPFLRAAQSGDITLMRLLLEYGANPSMPTRDNITALAVAAGIGWVEGITYEFSEFENLEAVKLCLELGIDVNTIDGNGRTAMHGAAFKGRPAVIQLLADHGARLDVRDYGSRDTRAGPLVGHGWQPIDYADGLVRIGVQSAIIQPEAGDTLRRLMGEAGLPVPPPGRTLDSICITEVCR